MEMSSNCSKSGAKSSDTPSLNIQAYIRVRPLNTKEKKNSCLEFTRKEVVIKSSTETIKNTKTLSFDRVFDVDVKQITVYNTVVKPMIKEVLQGYNCTVFAYGQTGTGKTYTMTGNLEGSDWSAVEDIHSGIIPRAMNEIFDELSKMTAEYQVSISYMELYNEKLGSLLTEDANIQLIDDLEGGVILRGLSPIVVKNKQEAYKVMQEGTTKKHMASTLLNSNSSRSHTIFSVKVVIKETLLEGKDDIVRIGKLHLIDLAGSENVSKSGASEAIHKSNGSGVNKRLAEASNINKSLLTLGRVITSIIENNLHIPYRESKLTRFLRDSLGGKTKTCIIGTISPAHCNLDETESTLNYAYKARSIKNKPEKNQKISKKEFMQVASEEIQKLKRDLAAVRQGDGFFISKETHEEMNQNMKFLQEQVQHWNDRYNEINASFDQVKETFDGLSMDYDDKCYEMAELEVLNEGLNSKIEDLKRDIALREYLILQYNQTESKLTEQAKSCKSVVENLIEQSNLLHDSIKRKEDCETQNITTLEELKQKMFAKLDTFQKNLEELFRDQMSQSERAANFSMNVAEQVVDQHRQVLLQMENLQVRVRDFYNGYFKAEEEKRTDKIGEETTRLGDSVTQVLENHQQHLMELYNNVIQPCVVALNQDLQIVGDTLETTKDQIKVLNSDGKRLLMEFDQLFASINNIRTIFEDAACLLHQEINGALNVARESQQRANQSFKEMEELEQCLANMKKSATASQVLSCNAVNKLDSTLSTLIDVKSNIENKMENFTTRGTGILKKLITHQGEQSGTNEQLIKQMKCQVKAIAKTERSAMSTLIDEVNKERNSLKTAEDLVKQQVLSLKSCVNKQGEEIGLRMKEWGNEISLNAKNVASEVTRLDSTFEATMREENTRLGKSQADLERILEYCFESIGDITENYRQARYEPDVPTGNTPRRVDPESLIYPREFISTESRNVLMQRFKSEEQQSSSSSPSSSGSEAYKSQLLEESTPTQRANIRRSTSMPQIPLPQFVDDDKENVTTLQKQKKRINTRNEKLTSRSVEKKTFKRPLAPRNTSQ